MTNAMAFKVKHENSHHIKQNHRKERPYCTRYKYHQHTMGKCYKLHGYPPEFKPKQKLYTGNRASTMINQVTNQVTNRSSSEDHTA